MLRYWTSYRKSDEAISRSDSATECETELRHRITHLFIVLKTTTEMFQSAHKKFYVDSLNRSGFYLPIYLPTYLLAYLFAARDKSQVSAYVNFLVTKLWI